MTGPRRLGHSLLLPLAALTLGASGDPTVPVTPGAGGEARGLGLADLAAYRAALEPREGGTPAPAVTFRDLWDRPGEFRGRRVRVEARVARRFRQGTFGTFPPLVEAWAFNPQGDPFCLVFPDTPGAPTPPGTAVAFEGTYLKTITYQGADTARLAPLLVGSRPPVAVGAGPASRREPWGVPWRVDWGIGLAAAALVAAALARQHLRGPSRPPPGSDPRVEPPPEFCDAA